MNKDIEQDWIFTWGFGHEFPNSFTKIFGTYHSARQGMNKRHGPNWAFQYGSEQEAGVEEFHLNEIHS